MRTTKFIELGADRRLGLFLELFNIFDNVNHGSAYNGNGRSSAFRTPTGYMPRLGIPRQAQVGARFLF
jgi:hypothetical protein